MDVTSLYTCIPHSDGLKALKHFLNKRASPDPPTDTLIRLAELVLNKNTFSFRDEVFSQMNGVAMGTKMGPSYACLFMGHLEHTLLQQYKKPVPEIYNRSSMTASAQPHWATTNFWILSTLCRISIPLSNSPTTSLKNPSLSRHENLLGTKKTHYFPSL